MLTSILTKSCQTFSITFGFQVQLPPSRPGFDSLIAPCFTILKKWNSRSYFPYFPWKDFENILTWGRSESFSFHLSHLSIGPFREKERTFHLSKNYWNLFHLQINSFSGKGTITFPKIAETLPSCWISIYVNAQCAKGGFHPQICCKNGLLSRDLNPGPSCQSKKEEKNLNAKLQWWKKQTSQTPFIGIKWLFF